MTNKQACAIFLVSFFIFLVATVGCIVLHSYAEFYNHWYDDAAEGVGIICGIFMLISGYLAMAASDGVSSES